MCRATARGEELEVRLRMINGAKVHVLGGAIQEPEATQQRARRESATRLPWSLAVLSALDLSEYQSLPTHERGFIARRLGVPETREAACLELLEASGQVRRKGGRFVPTGIDAVDLNEDRSLAKARRAFWGGVAVQRAAAGRGMSAYNVCGISRADLVRLKELEREYLARARAIIAESRPVECVALLQVNVIDLTQREARS